MFAENLENGSIVGQRTDGTGEYHLSIPAAIDDTLILWYRIGDEDSQSLKLTVPEKESQLGLGGGQNVPAPDQDDSEQDEPVPAPE